MFGSTILAIIIFGCLLAISIFGLVKSNASASKLEATRNRRLTEPSHEGASRAHGAARS